MWFVDSDDISSLGLGVVDNEAVAAKVHQVLI